MSTAPAAALRTAPGARGAEAMLRLEGIGKRYAVRRNLTDLLRHPLRRERATALRGIGLSIGEGEFFGLLGPNGAGKTTLFKILATLILPDEGSATVAGYDVVREAAAVRRVLTPVVADERSLFWRLSARENLRLFAALHGLRRGAAEERVEEMLGVVGLEETGEKLVGAFSSGMKQRLLLARALLSRPRVLLLDEPTRGLDPLSARKLRRLLRDEVVERQGCTVLLATHNAEEALELCDRLAILHRGELLAVGTAEELLQRYGDERYRLWVRDDEHWSPALLMGSQGVRACRTLPGGEDCWTQVEVVAQGGRERAAAMVAGLTAAGVAVAGVERVEIALAELLERIVRAAGGGDA